MSEKDKDTVEDEYVSNTEQSAESKGKDYRWNWARRTRFSDWFNTWIGEFVDYYQHQDQIQPEMMHYNHDDQKAEKLYDMYCTKMRAQGRNIKQAVWKLTLEGMFKYGFQLTVVELFTIAAIYSIRLIIDYLNN